MRAYHNSWKTEYREPFGAALCGSVVRISIDVEHENSTDVLLHIRFNDAYESVLMMSQSSENNGVKHYSVEVNIPEKSGLLWYYFEINDGEQKYYYMNNDEQLGGEGKLSDSVDQSYQITVYKQADTPRWYKYGIAYQIFPDRFARDDEWKIRTGFAIETRNRNIDPELSQKQFIEEDWDRPAYYVKDDEGNVREWPFYGGSLKGIIEHLDYLKSYGVSIIYLNPIFKAVSNHRYDTADYMAIDPILGSEDDFRTLAREAKQRGISIVLDGVFSHTGADSLYFDKYSNFGGNGAYSNPESQYRYWYKLDENEENGYKSWWGIKDLPEVDENNAFYRQMICGENGVLQKWLKAGARGFRLDVADELPDSFIRDIRSSIKYDNKDNILLGEVWEDASNKISYGERRNYLMGDELDSTMNYPLRQILLDYINYTITAEDAGKQIMSLKENYPRDNFYAALNILGTHDSQRILTAMAAYEDYNSASMKVKLLSSLQYTLPGVPCIYYGDEVGMQGDADPTNRNAFPWGKEDMDLSYHYRMLGLIYNDHPALVNGDMKILVNTEYGLSQDVFAFIRYNDLEKILVLVNRSYGDTKISLGNIEDLKCEYALDLLKSEELQLGEMALNKLETKIILLSDSKPGDAEDVREAGVLCHISSLPGGMLGKPARDFVDWIAESGMKVWQVLPLNPTGLGDCPYNSFAAFAGNPEFINYSELPGSEKYDAFCYDNAYWLKDYLEYKLSLIPDYESFSPIKKNAITITLIKEQYYFDYQWKQLKAYANSKGVRMMGDLPMFVSAESADVKFNPDIFLVDENGRLSVNAGVPPDDFSDEGQNWGLALYDWNKLRSRGYDWWVRRIKQCAERFDILRMDHFRAFSEYYAIPYGRTPKEGSWQSGPGIDFFNEIERSLAESGLKLEIIAEDLGLLDAGVKNLIKLTGYAGMDIWQFSADEMKLADPEYARNRVYYTGTHDNHTLMGWIIDNSNEISTEDAMELACESIMWLFKSPAKYVIVPLQDMFLLDDSARMNVPGVPYGNWKWKITEDELKISEDVSRWYRDLIASSGR